MAKMFSGNVEKKIPKDLRSCYKPDNVSTILWRNCELWEKIGSIIFWVLLVGGLIFSIVMGITAESFGIFLYSALGSIGAAFIQKLICIGVAVGFGTFAALVQNTKISANIALYNSAKLEGITDDYEEDFLQTKKEEKIKKQKTMNNQKLETLEKWKNEGLITEEEYNEQRTEIERG